METLQRAGIAPVVPARGTGTLGLRPIGTVLDPAWELVREVLGEDVTVGPAQGFETVRNRFLIRPYRWVITLDGAPVGLFSLQPCQPMGPGFLEMGTVLAPVVRGTGVNAALKAAVAAGVHDEGRYRLVAQVAQSNVVSIAAMAKAFPGVQYLMSPVPDPDPRRIYLVFQAPQPAVPARAAEAYAQVVAALATGR